jgi:amino acid permease
MYVGIAFIAVPHAVAQAGFYGAAIGFVYILISNIFCVYILLKARNRFKREDVVDVCDLAACLYGDWTRPLMSILLICTNACFLMAYTMFLGTQTDQLMCKTFKAAECGYRKLYSVIILTILLPVLFLKRLKAIGIFSLIILIFTFLAIGIIIYLSIVILQMSPQEADDTYGLKITDDDRDYKYFDGMMIPIFCAAMMSLFEGNQQILNLYSETDKPQNFFLIATSSIIILTFFVAAVVGYLGYLAFGNSVKSVILYSLPNEDPLAIIAKCCYLLTIMGSFTILIQPIFYVIESSNWYISFSSLGSGDDKPDEMMDDKDDKPMDGMAEAPEMGEPPMMEGGSAAESKTTKSELLDDREGTCWGYTLFFLMRTLIVVVIVGIAFLIPNLSILITFGGAVLGTIVNIVIPVLFYNRAYNHSEKNRKLKKKEENMMMNNDGMMDMMAAGDADDAQPMMEGGMEDAKPPEMMMDDMN